MNVLMTAASRRVALAQAFQAALRPFGGRLVVTDVDPSSPAVHVADRAYRVPCSADPQYIRSSRICAAERIRLVVPTIDDELGGVGGRARPLRGRRCAGRLFVTGDRRRCATTSI